MSIHFVFLVFKNGPAHPLSVHAVALNLKKSLKKTHKLSKGKSSKSNPKSLNSKKKIIWYAMFVEWEIMSMSF